MIFNFFCKRKLFCFVFRQFSRQRLLLSDYLHISENNRSALKRHIIIFNRILSLFFQFQFLKFRKLNHSVQFRFKNILITFDTFYFLLNGFSVQFSLLNKQNQNYCVTRIFNDLFGRNDFSNFFWFSLSRHNEYN